MRPIMGWIVMRQASLTIAARPLNQRPAVLILRHQFDPHDNRRLSNLCGPMDEHLREIEAALQVRITRRNEWVHVDGPKDTARQVLDLLISLHERASRPLPLQALQLALAEARAQSAVAQAAARPRRRPAAAAPDMQTTPQAESSPAVAPPAGVAPTPAPDLVLHTRRPDLRGRTPNQLQYLRQILATDITFGIGPAGTGKTFLAVACAVDALERQGVQRIVLTRPAVEAGERLGFLPGDLAQKVDPYLRPLYDALYDLMGFDRVTRAFERGQLEIAPLAFMRGRTLNQAFVILDEAQNTTREQMKMFLTRIGFGSKCVVTGDVSQIDLPSGTPSGLVDAAEVLKDVKGIAFTRFTAGDVVRHPLVARIVEAYDAAQADRSGRAGGPAPGGPARR
jgi:phosphate starvation-inducible PhoH-like protein